MQFLTSSLQPFERLQVSDGLLINADRWRQAHDYHRKRQNLLYQSLNQAGIVWGLGVCPIDAPAEVSSQFRDGRWLQIQPGLAIDALGNPVVVPQPIEFRISSEPLEDQPFLIYVVISYVDPDQLYRPSGLEVVEESFRIDEKNAAPDALEIELCRIWLQPGVKKLEVAYPIFFPQNNSLDLRYRVQAQVRASAIAQIATLNHQPEMRSRMQALAQSSHGLYSNLQINEPISDLPLEQLSASYHLTILSDQKISFEEAQLELLRSYLKAGGVLLIEVPEQDVKVQQLMLVRQQLEAAIAELKIKLYSPNSTIDETELEALQRSFVAELEAVNTAIQEISKVKIQPYEQFAQSLDVTLTPWNDLPTEHPLLSQPFRFGALPSLQQQSIQLWAGDGLIVIVGELSAIWQGHDRSLSRETIRSAQEFGINLVHYAWLRHQLTQLGQKTTD